MIRRGILLLSPLLALGLATPRTAEANLLSNGGFEDTTTSGFTDWIITGNGVAADMFFPNTGTTDAAFTDPNGTQPLSTLSQTVATTAGISYTLSFSLLDESGLSTDSFTIAFGGFSDTLTGDEAAPPANNPYFYTSFSLAIPGNTVTGSATTLTFTGSVNPINGTAWNLDDVALVAAVPVPMPEAPAWAVLSVGIVALFMMPGRRRRTSQ